MKIYEITQNTDKNEGLGHIVGTGIFFLHEEDAKAFVCSDRYRKFGVMGSKPNPKWGLSSYYRAVNQDFKIYKSLLEYDEDQKPNLDGQIREIDGRSYKLVLQR